MFEQTFLTVTSATLIFVLGQIIQNFILKPIQDFRVVLVDISHKVKFHSNVLTNSGLPQKLIDWARGDMRDLSCNLESKYLLIPFSSLFAIINVVPKNTRVKKAAGDLILLSNIGGDRRVEIENSDTIDDLKKQLKLNL